MSLPPLSPASFPRANGSCLFHEHDSRDILHTCTHTHTRIVACHTEHSAACLLILVVCMLAYLYQHVQICFLLFKVAAVDPAIWLCRVHVTSPC